MGIQFEGTPHHTTPLHSTRLGCTSKLSSQLRKTASQFLALLPTMAATSSSADSAMHDPNSLKTRVCIIGSGPAAHTAAIYAAKAALKPILFEGTMAEDVSPGQLTISSNIAPGGQLSTASHVEDFPGFPQGIPGVELTDRLRTQSTRFGTQIFTEKVIYVDFSVNPFKVFTASRTVLADSVIVATGAVMKKPNVPGSGKGQSGFWNRGVSAYAVRDGAAPMFRDKPLAVIGGGDSAMEAADFLSKYGSKVYIIHRRDAFRASKIMQSRVLNNPKIEVMRNTVVRHAYGDAVGETRVLAGLELQNVVSEEISDLKVSGLFFAIGQEPATEFLEGQLELDADGYILTKPGTTLTSVRGVFAAGFVQDRKYRQAVTAACTGCMAAFDVVQYLQEMEAEKEKSRLFSIQPKEPRRLRKRWRSN
ncbi:hypothetical protein SAY87_017235 [Trapa incisa]|uniref:FAD/NAD(P)-binding domain-containing protein n=1 Tax=Trapa incisa TaxID=236973 RepID=A0AAN7QV63_9MYRT|nr:hypothetical protein SAY87_017235 [Trapa incisa]